MRPETDYLRRPIRSLQNMLRVLAQDDPRHLSLISDGIYGPETGAAVARFQQLYGLPITSVTDQDTWEALRLAHRDARVRIEPAQPLQILLNPGQVIRQGQRHPHIHLTQAMLAALSAAWGSIPQPSHTGLLDETTADSLSLFQELAGLSPTGHLDQHTWKHLTLHYPLAANRGARG